jgi:hypothetical protein
MTNTAVSNTSSLNGAFLQEYNSENSIRRYLRETAGYRISYLLEHDYGSLYLDIIEKHVLKSKTQKGVRLWEWQDAPSLRATTTR